MTERYKQFFKELDKDGSGTVSREEFENKMRSSGTSDDGIQQFFLFCDLDRSGTITEDEFLRAVDKNDKADRMKRVFNKFDRDGSGFMEAEEFEQFLGGCSMSPQRTAAAKKFIKENDLDGDGKICFEEFIKILNE